MLSIHHRCVYGLWFAVYEAKEKTLQPTLLLMRVVQNFCICWLHIQQCLLGLTAIASLCLLFEH